MPDHDLKDAAGDALGGQGEQSHGDEAHVRHRGIGDELFHVLLHQRDQRGVDDGDDRQREDQRRELNRGLREHRQRKAQEAVTAHLQQDRGQDHRAGRRRLDMGVGQPGVDRPHRQLDRERGEEGEERPGLQRAREGMVQQRRDVGGAGLPVHRHDGEQHQHRAEQRVEEELEAGIDPARTAPHADDQEHRDQAALEEDIEQHQVERAEGADHQRLEHQEGDHVFAHPALDGGPARQDRDRHQRGGQDHERQRNAVDTHGVGDGAAEPRPPFQELEIGRTWIETPDQDQRNREGEQCGPQRHPARVAQARLVVAQEGDEQRAGDRQEGDDGKDRPARHQCTPANMNQVTKAATPISMAKA